MSDRFGPSLLAVLTLLLSLIGGQRLVAGERADDSEHDPASSAVASVRATVPVLADDLFPCGGGTATSFTLVGRVFVLVGEQPPVVVAAPPRRDLRRGSAGGARAP